MMATFSHWFGVSGLLSAAGWLAAVVLCLAFLRHRRRERAYAAALAAALAGWMFAGWHASRVGAIRLDQTDEIRSALEARQKQMLLEEQARRSGGAVVVRFAEDSAGESAGETIMTISELSPKAGEGIAAVPAQPAGTNAASDFRAGGKQTRSAGKVDEHMRKLGEKVAGAVAQEEAAGPMLKLPEYQLAGRLNRANRLLADLVLWSVLAVALGDYLRRFNRPMDPYFPLPIAGPWLENVSPSRLIVCWRGASDAAVRALLEHVIRKGQSFAYFGDRAGLVSPAIARLRFRRWAAWPLPVLEWGRAGVPDDPEFLLDAVWFNRYALTVPAARAASVLGAMVPRLAERAACRAVARKLPHLVWDAGALPDPAMLRQLAALCAESGVRLVLVAERVPGELAAIATPAVIDEAVRPRS